QARRWVRGASSRCTRRSSPRSPTFSTDASARVRVRRERRKMVLARASEAGQRRSFLQKGAVVADRSASVEFDDADVKTALASLDTAPFRSRLIRTDCNAADPEGLTEAGQPIDQYV